MAFFQGSCWNWVTAVLSIWRLLDQFPDIILWQERNISSSFASTLGIVMGSESWLSNFVLIFWIFITKKLPNESAKSFNEWGSGYCSCCNGVLEWFNDFIIVMFFQKHMKNIINVTSVNWKHANMRLWDYVPTFCLTAGKDVVPCASQMTYFTNLSKLWKCWWINTCKT